MRPLLVRASFHTFIRIGALALIFSGLSCKQRSQNANPSPVTTPVFKETPIITPNPVEPARVDELRENFLQTLKKIELETDNVRQDRPIARLLRAERREKTFIVNLRPEAVALTGGENPDTPILAAGGAIMKRHDITSSVTVEFPSATDDIQMIAVAKFLEDNIHVASVEPDVKVKGTGIPNDPRFTDLWGLRNNSSGIDIRANDAWDRTTGSRDLVVGIIDSGIDYNHPDLAPNIWINPGENGLDNRGRDKRSNGIDDDGNGYIDDFRGWNFIDNTNDPMDQNNHGTHVAGTIGAVGNNAVGVTGVNWQASLVGLKFLDANGDGYISDAIEALEYAVKMKFFATNNSWGGGGFSSTLLAAIKRAQNAGQLFITAAGNDAYDNDKTAYYPPNYDLPNIISVAAVDRNGQLGWFSSFGATKVHVAAPGVDILSTTRNKAYAAFKGTSMATPHVTGAAMLMKAADPTLDYAQIKARLISTSTALPALANKCVAKGMINAGAAVVASPDKSPPEVPTNILVTRKKMNSVTLAWPAVNDANRIGGIKNYALRLSEKPITSDDDWSKAKEPILISYGVSGDQVSASITLPVGSQLFAAIRSVDLSDNLSAMSQSIPINTLPMTQLATYDASNIKSLPSTTWISENDTVRGTVFSESVGKYPSNASRLLRLPSIPLRSHDKLVLRFWHRYELEKQYDFGSVILEPDDASPPVVVKTFTGASSGWELAEIDMTPALLKFQESEKIKTVTIGFRMTSDGSVNYDGWYLDDVTIITLPSLLDAVGIPSNPSIEKSTAIKLSQSNESTNLKIDRYGATMSPTLTTDWCANNIKTETPLPQSIIQETGLGLNRLCIKAPLADYEESILRIYSWIRIDAPPPVAVLKGFPSGSSNIKNITGSVAGSNVTSYAVYMTNGSSASCASGSYTTWVDAATPITLNVDKEERNLICVKGKGTEGVIQTDFTTLEWISDFTAPSAELKGTPPASLKNPKASIIVSSTDGAFYSYATAVKPEDCKSYSEDVPLATPILLDVSTGGDGPRALCVKAKDTAGNIQATPTILTWTQDTVAQPLAFLNLPKERSNATSIDVSVVAQEPGRYRYSLSSGTTCDTAKLQIAPLQDVSQPITEKLPPADGSMTLCAVMIDSLGNIQDSPTSFTWMKDTLPPQTQLAQLPPSRSSQSKLNVKVSGDDIDSYQYAIATGTSTCPDSSYGPKQSKETAISATISGTGTRVLCVRGIDAAGNVQTPPTVYAWTQLGSPIIRPELLRVPGSPNSKSLLNIGVVSPSGQNLVSYRYAFSPGLPPSCARVRTWSDEQSIARNITDNLGSYEGFKTLCVIAKDANGFEQLIPTAATWLKISGAQTSPSSSIYATATLIRASTSLSVKISRSGSSSNDLPAETLLSRVCQLNETTGAINSGTCIQVPVALSLGQKDQTITLPQLTSGNYVYVILTSSGSTEPIRFSR